MSLSSFVLAGAMFAAANAASTNANGHCAADIDPQTNTAVFDVKLNINSGNTGYYYFTGCGLMPTLAIEEGVTYTFRQTDETNWYHPLGFAYGPDGALSLVDELEKVVTPPGSNSNCAETASCQAPNYKLNGEELRSDPEDPEDFGLDEYEGNYFSGDRDTFKDAGNFEVDVQITDAATKEFFYFCHIHIGMSGRAIVYENGVPKTDPITPIPYEYDFNTELYTDFDRECGTFNAAQYSGDACPGKVFLCRDGQDVMGQSPTQFEQCFDAIDCAMHVEMRVNVGANAMTTFINQMIPHHRNAVNMAKIILKTNPVELDLPTGYGDEGELRTMMWEIINNQNAQITLMQNWLRDNGFPATDTCSDNDQCGSQNTQRDCKKAGCRWKKGKTGDSFCH
jgi:hypothetical protein